MSEETLSMQTARSIYDQSARHWQRRTPNLLTDFSARTLIFELCEDLAGKNVVDLGCGEGYVSRFCKSHGADLVVGIDISSSMIEKAEQQEQKQPLGIDYVNASITEVKLENNNFDTALGVFVFNYLTISETTTVFKKVFNALKSQGEFIFSLPHPFLPFAKEKEAPTYFDCGDYDYYSGRDKIFPGKVWCLDESVLDVQMLHKTFSDIFQCLHEAGFKNSPKIYELSVPEELVKQKPNIFQVAKGIPLHIVFELKK